MSDHQKRLSVPKSWPVERKEETFTVTAGAGPHGEDGVPLLIVLRDVLGYADSRKEARYALNQDNVVINGTPVNDEERPVGMFDIVAFDEREEYYRVFPDEGGRLALTPIDADAAGSKLGKIDEKRHVPGGDVQLTLHDGQTLLVDGDAYAAGDSLIVDNDTGEIVAHFAYEEGALVTAVAGSHAGEIGTIDEIQVTPGSSANNVLVEQDDGSFETVEAYIVVIDENFTSDDGDDTETDGDDGDGTGASDEDGDDEAEAADDADDAETGGDDADDAETSGDDADDAETADEADNTTQEGTE